MTGLNKATVSNLVADLINDELVQEIGPGESSGGRKPLMLLFRGTAGYAVGLELSVTRLKGVLTDLEGHIVADYAVNLQQHDAPSVFEQLKLAANYLMKQAPSFHTESSALASAFQGWWTSKARCCLRPT